MTQPPPAERADLDSGDAAAISPDIVERLCSLPNALGRLAVAYRSRISEDGSGWIDDFFRASARTYLRSPSVPTPRALGIDESAIDRLCDAPLPDAAKPLRLLSLRSHYFRGFLAADAPVDLSGGLIVVSGRNSHGKTSFAESLEWLLTGTLSRRSKGDARELEGCIGSIFTPATESTWVEARFQAEGEPSFTLKRELLEDFGSTTTSRCRSRLSVDGDALDEDSERKTMQRLFGGVAPLLMQHTLRDFVQSNPAARRQYFEQLLKLDDLTTLIEKAVIGDTRLKEFLREASGHGLRHWEAVLEALIPSTARTLVRALDRISQNQLGEAVEASLQQLAVDAFPGLAIPGTPLADSIRSLSEEQQKSRHQSFAPLAVLRPARMLDDVVTQDLTFSDVERLASAFRAAAESLSIARRAAAIVGDAQAAVSRAVEILKSAALIDEVANIQICPVCASEPASLERARLDTISSWAPLVSAVRQAETSTRAAADALRTRLQSVWKIYSSLLPSLPPADTWEAALESAVPSVKAEAVKTRASLEAAHEEARPFASSLVEVGRALGSTPFTATDVVRDRLSIIREGMEKLSALSRGYSASFAVLDSAVGTQAKEDPDYAKRALWIQAATSVDEIAGDLAWERAKLSAQKELSILRDALINARTRLLETRRSAFSDGMTEVWRTLRNDAHSAFESLTIPPPRGRGFPVSIEVKALLQGPGGTKSVDALRVFSESQVHVLGIAAFVTRSKLLGHRTLIFDDPVQSMDEDHFRTFAGPFLKQLLEDGFQILLLTHNQAFDRIVSFEHFDSDQYVTLSVTRTARRGCVVAEGNRRVAERLHVAEKKVDEGDLVSAWVWIRQALERLYTVVRIKYGPSGFDPSTWARSSAESMWNEGTGDLVTSRDPSAGQRLKQILDMTAGGAHDASRDGETDARNAIAYIRSILTTLRVGG